METIFKDEVWGFFF